MSRSYLLRETPQFKSDFREALYYIGVVLKNPIAAGALTDEYDRAALSVEKFPYTSQPLYSSSGEAYHSIRVKNYLAFYVVLDDVIEFRRFLYARSDLPGHIDS